MAQPTIIIGFDPGDTTGFARLRIKDLKKDRGIEVQDFGTVPIKGILFYLEFSNWLDNYLRRIIGEEELHCSLPGRLYEKDYRPGHHIFFSIEAPIPRNIVAAGQVKADEVRGIIKTIAEQYTIKYYLYQSSSVKKCFGSGRYTKAQLRKVVQMVLKTGPLKSPDVADALAVATCCALREFKADINMDESYRPEPRSRGRKKKIDEYSSEEIQSAVQEGRAVFRGKRIVAIKKRS